MHSKECEGKQMKNKPKTKKELETRIIELEAQLSSTYHSASLSLKELTPEKLTGSGILVKLHFIGGKKACPPFLIRDGFSKETIEALQQELRKSYDLSVMYKPIGYVPSHNTEEEKNKCQK